MKHKMSFVYEKDEEIGKLNEEIISLKKQLAITSVILKKLFLKI